MFHAIKEFFIGNSTTLQNHYTSPQRFISLAITLLATGLLIYLFKNKSEKAKRRVLTVLGISVFVTEVINKSIRYYKGSHDLVKLLVPMQFSSLVIVMMMVTVIYRKQWYLNLTVLAVTFAGIMYLALPGAGMNETPIRMTAFNSIYTHGVDFVFGVYAMSVGLTNFKFKDIWQPYLFFAICGIYGGMLNLVIYPGSSYFYLSAGEFRQAIKFIPYEFLLVLIVIIYVQVLYYIDSKRYNKKIIVK